MVVVNHSVIMVGCFSHFILIWFSRNCVVRKEAERVGYARARIHFYGLPATEKQERWKIPSRNRNREMVFVDSKNESFSAMKLPELRKIAAKMMELLSLLAHFLSNPMHTFRWTHWKEPTGCDVQKKCIATATASDSMSNHRQKYV